MARFSSRLDQVRIAAPCTADWEQMVGNDQVRFCGQCSLNVYNLSELTKGEAEEFIARNEGRLCVRYYRRADGSILTRNCPIGVRTLRRRLSRTAQAASTAVISFLAGIGFYGFANRPFRPQPLMGTYVRSPVLMGEMVEVPIQPAPTIQGSFGMGQMTIDTPRVHPVKSRRK